MRQRRLLVSIGILLTSTMLFAQQPLVLALPDTAANSGDTLRIDITTQQFADIFSFQFSFKWDAKVLQYAGFEQTNLIGVAVGNSAAANGVLRFSWVDFEGVGKTLPDNSSIVRLKFFVKGNTGDFTDLVITGMPLAIEVYRSDGTDRGEEVTLNPQNGLVNIGVQTIFRASFNQINIACRGDSTGVINTTLSNLPAGATIRWTGPNNFQSQQEDLTQLAAGAYTLEVSNNTDTLLDTTFIISQPATALAIDTIALIQAACTQPTGTATVTALGGTPPYRYSINNTFVNSNQFTNLATGLYTLTVRDSNNCTTSDTFRIQAVGAPQLTLPDIVSICNGQTDTLDAGTHTTYLWSTGATTPSIAISTPGTYGVTVTNAGGCSATDAVRVVLENTISVPLPDSLSICNGQAATLDAGAFNTYLWSTGATTRTINVSTVGNYSVTVTNAAGCIATDSVRVLERNTLFLPLPDSISICSGQTTTLNAGAFATYRWSTGATTQTIAVSTVGNYSVTVTNATGCTGTDSVRVLENNTLFLQLPDSISVCNGQTTTLDAGAFATYRWSNNATTRTISVSTAGTYRVTVTNTGGCTASDSIRVLATTAPQLELGDTTFICNGENVLLDAGEYTTYRWSTGATTRSITVSTAGNYSVTVTNAATCIAADTIQVQADASFEARIENDTLTICSGGSLQLRASLADTYQWIDTSKTLSAVNIRNPIARPRVTTGYTLIASSSCGSDTVKVEIAVAPATGTAGPDTSITIGDELELYASGGITYFWFLAEYPVSNARIPNPTTEPEDSTSYFVMITDANGCQKLDTINVFVADDSLDVKTVNMITPNGDGKNDALEFDDIEKFGINVLKVYNRWGDLVYQKINYQKDEDRFDGTRNGKPLPTGNYYYVLSFRDKEFKQTLTILRE